MNIDKIVISSKNTKAVEFFEDLNKKKLAFNKRAEAKLSKMILLKKVTL